MPARVYLIRHGETAWSRSGQHTSRTDLPLLPEGIVQAAWLKPRLSGVTFAHIFSSPRQRAQHTAQIAALNGPAVVAENDLREWEYGEYEGLTSLTIRERNPGWDIYSDGCPGGESPDEIIARADRIVAKLKAIDGNIAVFSHGHFLRVFAVRWAGFPLKQAQNLAISTASLGIVTETHETPPRAMLELWNERSG